jgi:ABC-2 type transport system ATP-binding protein
VLKQVGPAAEVIDNYMVDAQVDRQDDGTGGKRWGSGEGRIDKVEIIGRGGVATRLVRTGDSIVIRLHYSTTEPIERPVFGVGIETLNGVGVAGPNTRDVEMVPEKINGSGIVELAIDRVLLLPGTYDLATALYDYSATHPFDHRLHALRFDVEAGEPRQQHGFLALDGKWTIDGATPRLP